MLGVPLSGTSKSQVRDLMRLAHDLEGDAAVKSEPDARTSRSIVERYVHPTDEHKKGAMLRYEASQMELVQQAGRVERSN